MSLAHIWTDFGALLFLLLLLSSNRTEKEVKEYNKNYIKNDD